MTETKSEPAGVVPTESVGFSKARMESLVDGVYAFGMTLLVLGIGYPTEVPMIATGGSVYQYLVSQVPDLIHYVIAFLVLAGFWVMHHMQSHFIRQIDRMFLWINIFALLFVALIPFSSALAGDFPFDTLASVWFEGNLLIVGLLYSAQWWYATTDGRLINPSTGKQEIRHGRWLAITIPAFSVAGILLAILGIPYSAAVYLCVPVIFFVHITHYHRR